MLETTPSERKWQEHLPHPRRNTVEGGDGVDIIYIKRPMANVNLGSCSQANCTVSDDNSYDGDDPFDANITDGDMLVFLDGSKRLQ